MSPAGAEQELSVSLEPRLLFDPVAQARQAAVDAGLVPLRAAVAPAHDTSQEHAVTGLHADQGPPGVTL